MVELKEFLYNLKITLSKNYSMFPQLLQIKNAIQIQNPAHEVFEAIVNP